MIILLTALGTLFAGLAALFAWRSLRRRPKLKFYLHEEPSVMYDAGRSRAFLQCWLANVGTIAAHNVHGWLEYGDAPGPVMPEEHAETGVTHTLDECAAVYVERIMPNPPRGPDTGFLDSPRLFVFPVNSGLQ